jgi:hypothetical protein
MPGPQNMSTVIGVGSQNLYSDNGTTTGNWIDVSELEVPYTVFIRASGAGDTYQLMGSNEDPQPANATDGALVGSAINTALSLTTISAPLKWLKAKKTASSTATQPWLFGYRHK